MRFEMVNPQRQILWEIEDWKLTRDSVAITYAFCIRQRHEVDIRIINRAIINRWSMSALEYIKKRAWKMMFSAAQATSRAAATSGICSGNK